MVDLPLLGRTNQAFPKTWVRPRPGTPSGELNPQQALRDLLKFAIEQHLPIDVSIQPALIGGQIRSEDFISISRSRTDYTVATDHTHAVTLVQAHLIETLSAIGREKIDFYFLRVQRAAEEFQISGVLEALEMARQEGHIGYVGLACDGPSLASLNLWQFHDAFDAVLIPDDVSFDTLAPLAVERRVGVVIDGAWRHSDGPRIIAASSIDELQALEANP